METPYRDSKTDARRPELEAPASSDRLIRLIDEFQLSDWPSNQYTLPKPLQVLTNCACRCHTRTPQQGLYLTDSPVDVTSAEDYCHRHSLCSPCICSACMATTVWLHGAGLWIRWGAAQQRSHAGSKMDQLAFGDALLEGCRVGLSSGVRCREGHV